MPKLSTAVAALLFAATLPAQAIVGGTATSDFRHVDSGVQITANWVLTARHVGYSPGATYSNGYGSATVAERFALGGGPVLDNDLALLRLTTPIAAPTLGLLSDLLPAGTLAAPLAATITTGHNQVPRGYAFTQVREVIDQIDPDDSGPLAPFAVNWLLTYNDTFSAPYVQGGDSGGGLFLGQASDSVGALLMGITSAQMQYDGGGFGSAFVQLAAYRHWIDTTMAANLADDQLAQWISAVPEPASWAMWLAGLGLLVGAWRQRRNARRDQSCSLPL